ncbi:hypothetical protein B566_EDAN014957 [Ephemera danica]|nr:hypothetical protein B566_EDAN014957 [Ephemera danica]
MISTTALAAMRHGQQLATAWLVLVAAMKISATLPDTVRIGGLFNPEDDLQEIAFRYAVNRINLDRVLLPTTTLVPMMERVAAYDSFHTAKRVCNMTQEGVAAIFGPQSRHTASMALKELLEDMGWRSFTLIYQHDDALIRLQEVLKNHDPSDAPVTVRQLDPNTDDHRPLLKQILASSESHIILDCDTDKIQEILRQASEVKMLGAYLGYLITSLDLHTVDLEEIKNSGTNITALRILDPNSREVNNAVHDWTYGEMRSYGRALHVTPQHIKTEVALMHDAVNLFARALHDLGSSQRIVVQPLTCETREVWDNGLSMVNWMRVTEVALMHDAVNLFARALHDLGSSQRIVVQPLTCETREVWDNGLSMVNWMRVREIRGLTGEIRFDTAGQRTDFTLEVVEVRPEGLVRIATWDPHVGVNRTISYMQVHDQIMEGMANKTFKIYSLLGAPFLMKVQSNQTLTGNARFKGFSLDLIEEISKIRKFKYEFELEPDNRYGNYDRNTKQWDGLVKQILERKADFAICDLTITYDRERAVDFTMPFMNLGISILFSKPVKTPPSLFSFLSPLSVDVWIYMATAYLGVSLVLYMMARYANSSNPHPCNRNPEELESQFKLLNAMWFTIGSLMQQGCDFLPKLSPYEWISTHPCKSEPEEYENNLTLSNLIWHNCGSIMQQGSDIAPNADDLAKQTKIKYGAVRGGSTAAFFRDSNFTTYQRMWSFMESTRPSVFTDSNLEGVERVRKSKRTYAFLMESTNIEYNTERKCDLTRVGGLLDSKGYGIAMPRNSPYRTLMSEAVLLLQESGKLNELKNLWWSDERNGGGQCKVTKAAATAGPELGIANVGGVFVVLLAGLALACVVGVLEFLWNTQDVAVEDRAKYCDTFTEELRFALNCKAVTKPVHKSKSINSIDRSYEKL